MFKLCLDMNILNAMAEEPLVSIFCLTYNHASYIRQCLDGFLMQKATFAYEVIINDDASTDGTTEIIREYEEKYPDIIKPIYHEENLYSKGERGFWNRYCLPKSKGKYIALCEGDDYWIDPLKLQKQVDFLEGHPEYSMCFHKAKVIYDVQPNKKSTLFENIEERDYTIDELFLNWIVPTASIVCRRQFLDVIKQSNDFMYMDGIVVLSMVSLGKVHALSAVMSVYRRLNTGAILSIVKSEKFYERSFKNLEAIRQNFSQLSDKAYMKKYTERCLGYMSYCMRNGDLKTVFQILFRRKYFRWKYVFPMLWRFLRS